MLFTSNTVQVGRLKEAIEDCCEAIKLDPGYIRAYQRRAKLYGTPCYTAIVYKMSQFSILHRPISCYHRYQDNGQHDEAVRDFELVLQKDPSSENRKAVKDAKHQLKLSKRKDYYKILGLTKSATDHEIKKGYKKSAMLHHPDRHAGADDALREEEERIFKEVSEAYSVLSDPKKKSRYDNGQDIEEMGMG